MRERAARDRARGAAARATPREEGGAASCIVLVELTTVHARALTSRVHSGVSGADQMKLRKRLRREARPAFTGTHSLNGRQLCDSRLPGAILWQRRRRGLSST